MSAQPRLLVVDDEPDLCTLYELALVREGYVVDTCGTLEEAWQLLQSHELGTFQLVITDMRLPDGTGLELLQRIDRAGRSEKAVVITAYGSAENAVEALKAGAYDYLTKPVDLRQFRAAVASALGRLPAAASGAAALEAPGRGRGTRGSGAQALARIVGESAGMQQVRALVGKVARSMAPVLVQGESGTGKELVARAIHEASPRAQGPFVAVNCGAIPEQLLEAEFFGVRKGAFTGATEDRDGFFQAAQGGTLFLDEIGDLPLQMQSKLLRVIQERVVRAVGAVTELPTNVRLLSATHRDLPQEVSGGRFRQDLYYRLNVIRINVPPLRERLADLPAICAHVLQRIAHDVGVTPVPRLSAEAQRQLMAYRFGGNVRELENLLHRALALSNGPDIGVEDLGLNEELMRDSGFDSGFAALTPAGLHGLTSIPTEALEPGHVAADPEARSPTDEALRQTASPDEPLPGDLTVHLDAVERQILERALERFRYNRTAAGARLGLSLRQMRYRMARLGIGVDSGPDAGSEAGPEAGSETGVEGAGEGGPESGAGNSNDA